MPLMQCGSARAAEYPDRATCPAKSGGSDSSSQLTANRPRRPFIPVMPKHGLRAITAMALRLLLA
jgi:hypothetical protein